jgi:serine protease Do
MERFMRPYIQVGVVLLGAAIAITPIVSGAQTIHLRQIVDDLNPLLHSSSPGYLGVLVGDVDNDSANKLKLKDIHGAVITLIDHDAPAGQAGLRVNDVLLELNGQTVESAEAFGRMMREIPPGRKVILVISRDGATQTLSVELADRKKLDTDIWNKLNAASDVSSPVQGLGIFGNGLGGDAPLPGGFHLPFVGSSTLKVGAVVEPLTSQMADYLGVQNGLMVKQVGRKTEAAVAGMKAFDVILKVGTESISTGSDWDRALRANQGKSVADTILREKRQMTVTLQVDSKKKGELEYPYPYPGLLPDGPSPLVAFADPDTMGDLAKYLEGDDSAALTMRDQADALQKQLKQWRDEKGNSFGITPQQADEFRKQAEQFRDAFQDGSFGVSQEQLDQLKRQMDQFSKNFTAGNFGFDKKQMDELKRQMDEWNKNFPKTFQFDQKQMDELKQQMQEWQKSFPPQFE